MVCCIEVYFSCFESKYSSFNGLYCAPQPFLLTMLMDSRFELQLFICMGIILSVDVHVIYSYI